MSIRSLLRSGIRSALSICLLAAAPGFAQQQAQTPQASLSATRITEPIDDTKLITLRDNVHPLARPEFDRGPAPASMPTGRIMLVLRGTQQQQQALKQYLDSLQDPAAPTYRKWLTPAQFGQVYGPTAQDVQTVSSWLASQGFEVTKVAQARNVIEFSGSIGQVNNAFHANIHRYLVNGEEHFANSTDPQIPAAIAPVVAAVAQLNDFHPKAGAIRGPGGQWDPSSKRIKPDLTLQDQNSNNYLFVVPADAATIYDTPNQNLNANYSKISSVVGGKTWDGTGITIGVAGDSNINLSNVLAYRTAFLNDTSTTHQPNVIVDGNDPGINGDAIEALLDTEVSGGIAPGATIDLYTASSDDLQQGLFLAIFRALDDNAVSILNVSFGNCEANETGSGNQLVNALWAQAAAQGISVTVSTGDSGSAGCDNPNTETTAINGLAVSGLASTPYNVAVGGTDFAALESSATSFSTYVNTTSPGTGPYFGTALGFIPEVPWNESTTLDTTISANVATKDSQGNTNIVGGGGGLSSQAVCTFALDQNGNCTGVPRGYSKPAFQSGLTPNDSVRDLPDVSLFASNLFYNAGWAVCLDQAEGSQYSTPDCLLTNGALGSNFNVDVVGGTSAASPAFAGMLALVAQSQGGIRLGQADTVLYALAKSNYSTVFHDTTTGNNSMYCGAPYSSSNPPATQPPPNCSNNFLTGYDTTTGYDTASGLGSVDVSQLVAAWSSVKFTPTSDNFTINGSTAAINVTHGTALTFSSGITPGTATGNVALETTSALPNQAAQSLVLPVNSGTASGSYNGLPGGSYNVYSYYGGDVSDAASSSNQIAVNITPENSTTSLVGNFYDASTAKSISSVSTASTNTYSYGSYSFFHATPYGNASTKDANGNIVQDGIPTGNVTFINGGTTNLDTAAVNSQGSAAYSLTTLAPGTYSMTANYSGDPGLNANTSNTIGFAITKAVTTTTVTPSASSIQSSASAVLTVTVGADSLGAMPSGSVSVTNGGAPIATGALTPAYNPADGTVLPTATVTIPGTSLAAGTANSLTVSYNGDANYGGSSASATVTISSAGTGSGFSVNGSSVTLSAGSTVQSQVTVTPAGGFTGQVNLTCSVANTLGQLHLPGCNFNGQATGSVTISGAGAASTNMTITTTANTAANSFPLEKYFDAAGGTALACLLIFAVPARRRSWQTMLGLLIVIVSMAGLGCGSNNNGGAPSGGTAAGNYNVTVTGTDAATGKVTATANVTVTVQ